MKDLRIALAGNPNSGKTTLFNAITGAHHKVGNYPGVTVEKREGIRIRGDRQYHFIDLPGIYSLTAYSIDEVVARDFILDEKPDIIVDVLDSTNLERNLYLCLQFQELGIPVICALNMTDEAEAKGIIIDEKTLSESLGIPLVKTIGTKGSGVDAILDCIDNVQAEHAEPPALLRHTHSIAYGDEIELKLKVLEDLIKTDTVFAGKYPVRWLAEKLLEKDANAFERLKEHTRSGQIENTAREASIWIDKHYGKDSEIIITEQRYGYIRGAVKESIRIVKHADFSVTEAIDRVIMNRFLALPIFVLVLWAMFQITFFLGEYPMGWLESLFSFLGNVATKILPEGMLRSLVVDGIIGGVGGVFSFVPLIVILFFLLSILEDVGYMSRAAFATDKFLHAFGLHGQSIFPMMLGFGCSVPAIMASRTLKSPRDRILTVLITPLMSCGAKLPVHVLLAAAFFPEHAANMVILIYGIGVILSLLSAILLKNTVLKGEPTPFVMELPPYRSPTLQGVLWHVWEKTWMYIRRAGSVILMASILIWAITSFPVYHGSEQEDDSAKAQAALEYSFAGRIGHFIEPVFSPLGFDWKIAIASVTGFAAKEVIVSTQGILYRVGTDATAENEGLRDAIRRDPHMRPLVAFVFMLFTLIIPPCFAALASMKAEIGVRWVGFELIFLFSLGWILSFIVYQIGTLLGA
ncbi:ferrous iron transport protein B [Leadbettera azotonutricia]|uniref:Ferrous iron transport protein B n=1 Tax=Leadbettera azotonutricia (strain ATCC BAA-888 / DSM 13862 / ZAS-9) TaxID=545695 RepID=F5YBY3_LEAAZ|nr:ferrous iron transport protein B [Leadbettera azotonutricia]AEF81361.1 ferrous iron transport protein B [Leadbettera azotonutricia ZAS-9]